MCDKCDNISMRNNHPDFLYCPYCGEEFGIDKVYGAISIIKNYCKKHKCRDNCKFFNVKDDGCILFTDDCSSPEEWLDF